MPRKPEYIAGRVEMYFSEKYSYYGDDKCFSISFKNEVLESLLTKYHYSTKRYFANWDEYSFDTRIPDYSGVQTIAEVTKTLISALVTYGESDNGFEEDLKARENEIMESFVSIKGTSAETDEPLTLDGYNVGKSTGFDFEYKDGEYIVSYRECSGGW